MDLEVRIKEIRTRIDTLRLAIEHGEIEKRHKTVVEETIEEEQHKPKSGIDDLKAKLMKKK
jgi:hypothetical protein